MKSILSLIGTISIQSEGTLAFWEASDCPDEPEEGTSSRKFQKPCYRLGRYIGNINLKNRNVRWWEDQRTIVLLKKNFKIN